MPTAHTGPIPGALVHAGSRAYRHRTLRGTSKGQHETTSVTQTACPSYLPAGLTPQRNPLVALTYPRRWLAGLQVRR